MADPTESLNADCHSATVDCAALEQALRNQGEDFYRYVTEHCPHLFASVPLFVSATQAEQMRAVIAAVENVVGLPAWRATVIPAKAGIQTVQGISAARDQNQEALLINPLDSRLRWNDGINIADGFAKGVFFGYDFHLNADGAHLIEINTNAGGAFLNDLLLQSQRQVTMPGEVAASDNLEQIFLDMFRNEWRLERGDTPLQTVAIVDEQPQQQYLFPEFLLTQRMFERAGITALIADPAELEVRSDGLYCRERKIDLVYNRLTDFHFKQHTALSQVFQNSDLAVITPHPWAYALYADKYNLTVFSSVNSLRELGAAEADIAVLQAGIPQTRKVLAEEEEQWWQERKQWFFKPSSGFGSRGTYRGANVTHRVFTEIMQGGYVAQRMATPGGRAVCGDDEKPVVLKSDVRCYVYDGQVQLIAARLYQGQTTNFRTLNGGFAQVRII